jgi:hypothetical protein
VILAIVLGIAMTAFCLVLQATAAWFSQRWVERAVGADGSMRQGRGQGFARIIVTMTLLMIGVLAQLAAWATLYRALGLFEDFEEALYFSGVVFTSLGFGDTVIKTDQRLLAPIEAANGLMMFAIVTAVLIGAIQREAGKRG